MADPARFTLLVRVLIEGFSFRDIAGPRTAAKANAAVVVISAVRECATSAGWVDTGKLDDWRNDYNNIRPYSSLEGLTPMEFAPRSCLDRTMNRANLLMGTIWGARHCKLDLAQSALFDRVRDTCRIADSRSAGRRELDMNGLRC